MDPKAKHTSLWQATCKEPHRFPTLDQDLHVDVVIVGGGITGLTAAHQLKKAGLKVAVLEQHRVAGGESAHTTAHLTQVSDTPLSQLVSGFGAAGARAVWEAGSRAIDHIEATAVEENIECHFQRVPAYWYAACEEDAERVHEEANLARRLGFEADYVDDRKLPPMGFGAMRLFDQAQFHPRRYLLPLAQLIPGEGSYLFEEAHVSSIRRGQPVRVEANGFAVTADHLVLATHQAIHNPFFASKVPAYQTYVIGARVPRGTFPAVLGWSTADPYHYWRLEQGTEFDTVVIGGEDHRTGQDDDTAARFERLEAYAHSHLNGCHHEIAYCWSGQVLVPVDGVPYIGRAPEADNEYVATGFAGTGMTMGTYAGLLITDLVLGRERAVASLFAPGRFKLRAGAVTFIEENLAVPAYMIGDRLSTTVASDVAPGEGKVIALNGEHVAAYREPDGTLRMVSAVCSHMGCLVHFNAAEKTWDCPCHGSRYELNGEVLAGPALRGLAPIEERAEIVSIEEVAEEVERPARAEE